MALKISRPYIGIWVSLIASFFIFFVNPFQVDAHANKVLAVGALIIALWISEAMPMPVVALLPLVLFPFLNIASIETTASSFSNPIIYLFMGGFLIGLAIEKWNPAPAHCFKYCATNRYKR
jgi:sodium-dependent dicarboxylate transporter 2/3/5